MNGRHIVAVAVGALLAGLFCLKPPELPEWDVDLTLPVYHGQVRLAELLDPSRFSVAPDSTVLFLTSQPFDTVRPDAAVEFLSVDEPSEIRVSDFLLASLGSAVSGLGIEELTGIPVPDSGIKAAVEPFAVADTRVCAIEDVERVEAVEGFLRTEVVNRTGLEFDSVLVATQCGSVRLEKLAPGETRRVHVPVAGRTVSSPLVAAFAAGSPGSRSDSLRLRKTDSLVVRFALDSLRICRGRLRIPAVQAERRCPVYVTCTRPMRIDSLVLEAGECEFQMANRFGFPLRLRLDARKLGKSDEFSVDGDRSVSTGAGLAGIVMDNRGRTNSLFDFRVTAATARSEGLVDIEKGDGVSVCYRTAGLKPRRVAGEFREPVYVASALDTVVDFRPLGVRGVRMAGVELVLDLENRVGFPVETELKLTAVRDGRSVVTAEQLLALPPATSEQPVLRSWTIPLTALVNCGPDLITAEYVTRILGVGWFAAGAGVVGSALVSSPLRLALVPDTVNVPARRIQVSPAQRRALGEHLRSGEARLTITNRFPVGVGGRLTLAPDSGMREVGTEVDSLTFGFGVPAGRRARSGHCVAPRETTFSIALDSIQASLFKTWPLNAGLRLMLPESDTVIVRASDYLGVSALVRLRLRVKE